MPINTASRRNRFRGRAIARLASAIVTSVLALKPCGSSPNSRFSRNGRRRGVPSVCVMQSEPMKAFVKGTSLSARIPRVVRPCNAGPYKASKMPRGPCDEVGAALEVRQSVFARQKRVQLLDLLPWQIQSPRHALEMLAQARQLPAFQLPEHFALVIGHSTVRWNESDVGPAWEVAGVVEERAESREDDPRFNSVYIGDFEGVPQRVHAEHSI
ncbi:hypothetical protein K525DRAFT_248358 [Schizophyllum commune Loenen D]|nr:hypothetical protein K525DRAFT_248358 [Schizophyllum commune Loenen D]